MYKSGLFAYKKNEQIPAKVFEQFLSFFMFLFVWLGIIIDWNFVSQKNIEKKTPYKYTHKIMRIYTRAK